jgi:NAD(P)-dependent dehydrogenase (short-subunit alcohol dehydrogenase family)
MKHQIDRLTDKHVVVVGGSSGMGLAIARQASAAGARLTLLARDANKLESAASQVRNAGFRTIDLKNMETIPASVANLGVVDHLVVTAGTARVMPLASTGPTEWRAVVEERLIGPLLVIKILASQISESIVFFSGTIARRPTAAGAIMAAAAAGVENMVRALSLELSPVRVNAVVPGMVDTPMLDDFLSSHKQQAVADMTAKLPAKRIGTADDAAQAALLLMTNPFVNGASIVIDGGGVLV